MFEFEKSDMLKWFLDNRSDMVHRMRNTLQSYSQKDISPFHLEDDVWSHTLLVLKMVDVSSLSERWKRDMVYLICILHDVGKIFKRNSHKPRKISFFDHDQAGVQFALETILDRFIDKVSDEILGNIIYFSLNVVGKHDKYYNSINEEYIKNILNNDINLEKIARIFCDADHKGRFTLEGKDREIIFSTKDRICDLTKHIIRDSDINYWVYCGSPGSGKDKLAKDENLNIVSFDDIRIRLYKEKHNEELDNKSLYKNAWSFCKRLNLNQELIKDLKKCDKKDRISICNVNLNIKSRKECVDAIKGVFGNREPIGSVLVLNTLNNCVTNDNRRSDKTIGEDCIKEFIYEISIPTLNEGFTKVKLVLNLYPLNNNQQNGRILLCQSTSL